MKAISSTSYYVLTILIFIISGCSSGTQPPENLTSQDITNSLDCVGNLFGYQASISGERLYSAYNALGDGSISFNGTLSTQGWDYPIKYEGYTANAPYSGFIEETQDQWISIAVLDNTAGNFIIYDGRPTLNAPDIFGEFDCTWD